MNDGAAHFTGSHIAYVDYDKTALHNALNSNGDIAPTVKMAGELFDTCAPTCASHRGPHLHLHHVMTRCVVDFMVVLDHRTRRASICVTRTLRPVLDHRYDALHAVDMCTHNQTR